MAPSLYQPVDASLAQRRGFGAGEDSRNRDLDLGDERPRKSVRPSMHGTTLSPTKISQKVLDKLIDGSESARGRFDLRKVGSHIDKDFARIGAHVRHKNLTTQRQRPNNSKTDLSPTRLPNLDRAKLALPPDLPTKGP